MTFRIRFLTNPKDYVYDKGIRIPQQGFTYGEAIIKTYNEEHNTNIPISFGSGMGTGFTVASVCGSSNSDNRLIKGKINRLI